MRLRIAIAALAGAWLAVAAAGCATRQARETVVDRDGLQVVLRGPANPDADSAVFEHPMVISTARAAHILSRLDVRRESKGAPGREPAISTALLYPIAEGLSKGLESAEPHQEVLVMATRRERRFGIFTREYLTSFLAYRMDDLLHVHVSHIDLELERGPSRELPEPWANREAMKFRVLPGTAMVPTGAQSVAVNWRDPIFDEPTAVQFTPLGRARRRTILMEAPPEPEADEALPSVAPPPPDTLSPEALRALADLEEQRQSGAISEAEYMARRQKILDGTPDPP